MAKNKKTLKSYRQHWFSLPVLRWLQALHRWDLIALVGWVVACCHWNKENTYCKYADVIRNGWKKNEITTISSYLKKRSHFFEPRPRVDQSTDRRNLKFWLHGYFMIWLGTTEGIFEIPPRGRVTGVIWGGDWRGEKCQKIFLQFCCFFRWTSLDWPHKLLLWRWNAYLTSFLTKKS